MKRGLWIGGNKEARGFSYAAKMSLRGCVMCEIVTMYPQRERRQRERERERERETKDARISLRG